jgi:tRNA (cytidine/uridine-2'-O-)-methyltransferase
MAFSIALYQPDIAGNTGTILRTAACLGFGVEIIEPCGFDISDRNLKRAGLDYAELAVLRRHSDWSAFEEWRRLEARELVLMTTKASHPYTDHMFRPKEVIMFGRESAGVPEEVHLAADARLIIPMAEGRRSLNLAVSVGIVAGEMLRQTGGLAP